MANLPAVASTCFSPAGAGAGCTVLGRTAMEVDDDAAAVQQPDYLGVCSTATSIGGADLAQEEAAAVALPEASRAATASFEGGNRLPPRLEGSAFGGESMDVEHDSSSPTGWPRSKS